MTATNRPWLEREDWRSGVVEWRGAPVAFLASIIPGFIFLAAWWYFSEGDWFAILFGLGGAALLIGGSVRAFLRERRYGRSTFSFDRVPFIAGSKLTGKVRTSAEGLGNDWRLMLCHYRGGYDEENGPDWRVIRAILPQHFRLKGDQAEIDVEFDVPADAPPTTLSSPGRRWELSIVTGFPGRVRSVRFIVPVFGRDAERFVQETAAARSAKRDIRRALSVFDDQPD